MSNTRESIQITSLGYELLPFAFRLENEGESVELVVSLNGEPKELLWRGEFTAQSSWSGNRIRVGDHIYPELATERAPSSHLRLGFWFDGDEALALHALICDVGLWPGGLGPQRDGGLTLVRIDSETTLDRIQELVDPLVELLRSRDFRGLVQAGLQLDTSDGRLGLSGLRAGWPYLQTHAFLSELEGFGQVLRGEPPVLPRKFVTVIPMSLPPYPFVSHDHILPAPRRIVGPSPPQIERTFWHDVQIRGSETRELWTSTTFGLVGVARGAADTSELARALALEIPPRLGLPDLQYRPDVGQGVQAALAQVEALFGVVL